MQIHKPTHFQLVALAALTAAMIAMPGVAKVDITSPTQSAFSVAAGAQCSTCLVQTFERTVITDDIAHYRAILKVGPGQYDQIGIHRVVRERAPYRPRRQAQAAFLAHGINVGFEGTFMANIGTPEADPRHNLPVFLAQRDIDVWGIDFRWTLVPGEVDDIAFMANWGLEGDASDLRIGLATARLIRWLTWTGTGKIDLLGYSRGGRIAYAYLNDETELRPGRRHVDRVVQLDSVFKSGNPDSQAAACSRIADTQAAIDAGSYANDIRGISVLGRLALDAPDDPSPFFDGQTNRQAALRLGATPFEGTETFHAFAGLFEDEQPIGLRFTDEPTAYNLLASAASYQPTAGLRDLLIVLCNDGRSELDDHLDEITVPVLYIGAAGGNRAGGTSTFPFLGSTELESIVVSLDDPGNELVDVGHGDILTMDDADQLVWEPIFDWFVEDPS